MTHDMSLKGWNAVIETNLTGTFLMSKEVFNQFFHEHGGVITNIIAVMERGFPMMGHTGAARAAVENMTKYVRISLLYYFARSLHNTLCVTDMYLLYTNFRNSKIF